MLAGAAIDLSAGDFELRGLAPEERFAGVALAAGVVVGAGAVESFPPDACGWAKATPALRQNNSAKKTPLMMLLRNLVSICTPSGLKVPVDSALRRMPSAQLTLTI